jgi:hypothetical protein
LFGGEDQMNNDIAAGLGHLSFALFRAWVGVISTQGEAQKRRLTLGCILGPLRGPSILQRRDGTKM